ncbi:hypothetical protein [Nannocystis sp.]|uniref:hypothetical protein n=1 Tax=Nannocystis sp. TaxID=1962667 RepID=UPI0025D6F0C0|nr:hypothetical protein [Nannocystis sp.]MBK7830496.1 hypothetical protein [Nannocystis sp.]
MNFRTDLEILALEPQGGGMTLIEARATDGSTVVLLVRVVEPLVVGGHMALALTAEVAAPTQAPTGKSMRDRLQARLSGTAPAATAPAPRLAISLNTPGSAGTFGSPPGGAAASGSAGTSGAASSPNGAAAPSPASQSSSAAGDASSLLLSSILGASPRSSVNAERDVDDEMDALFGARRKG